MKEAPDGHDKKHKTKKESKKSKADNTSIQKRVAESCLKSDGLREAIEGAKKTLKEALDDNNENAASDTVTGLSKEVAALRNRSDEMKREIEKLRQDFQGLVDYVQKGVNVPLVSKKQLPLEQPREVVEDKDFDLFASSDDEENAEKERIRNERLREYAEKKAKKPETIAKSSVILDIKPWDDTTNMQEMEELVRAIKKDGLVWGSAKLTPLAYGIRVLQIICVVEDEKISVDDLIEQITEQISDHVQSVDIVAFNKI